MIYYDESDTMKYLVIFMSILGIFCGSIAFYFILKQLLISKKSLSYLQTTGEIIKVELVKSFSSDGYEIDTYIVYRYLINNIEYFSDVIRYGPKVLEYERYDLKYSKGDIVNVFYDSINPEFAVLENGEGQMYLNLYTLIIPILILLFSFISLYNGIFRN